MLGATKLAPITMKVRRYLRTSMDTKKYAKFGEKQTWFLTYHDEIQISLIPEFLE